MDKDICCHVYSFAVRRSGINFTTPNLCHYGLRVKGNMTQPAHWKTLSIPALANENKRRRSEKSIPMRVSGGMVSAKEYQKIRENMRKK